MQLVISACDIVAAGIAVCTASSNDWRPMVRHFGAERARQIVGRGDGWPSKGSA